MGQIIKGDRRKDRGFDLMYLHPSFVVETRAWEEMRILTGSTRYILSGIHG